MTQIWDELGEEEQEAVLSPFAQREMADGTFLPTLKFMTRSEWHKQLEPYRVMKHEEAIRMTREQLEERVAILESDYIMLLGRIEELVKVSKTVEDSTKLLGLGRDIDRKSAAIDKERSSIDIKERDLVIEAIANDRETLVEEVKADTAARSKGGKKRHAKTTKIKMLIKQAWLSIGEKYDNVSDFAYDMQDCFDFPKEIKSVYPWIKKWETED